MAKNAAGRRVVDDVGKPAPLSEAEKAAITRARADVKAGRLHDHDEVAERLRRRAAEIVNGAKKAATRRR